ncbi:hypothetical protein TREES_T100021445, partial [Tupaia chinensis]
LQVFVGDPVTTCLSPTVYHMICEVGFEVRGHVALSSIVSEHGAVCWKAFTDCMRYLEPGGNLYLYGSDVHECLWIPGSSGWQLLGEETLGPEAIGEAVTRSAVRRLGIHLLQARPLPGLTSERCIWFGGIVSGSLGQVPARGCGWKLTCLTCSGDSSTAPCCAEDKCDEHLCPSCVVGRTEAGLVFTTAPLSPGQVDVLRVFVGAPRGLNLRNVLWHGFAAPQEVPPRYCSVMLLLTVGLGQLLRSHLQQTGLPWVRRPLLTLTDLEDLTVFAGKCHLHSLPRLSLAVPPSQPPSYVSGSVCKSVTSELLSVLEAAMIKSTFVLTAMLPYWEAALTRFKASRFADCTILLLTQLEAGLRRVFAAVNRCPQRLLTAESTAPYTTLDEILAEHLSDGEVNRLPVLLGEPAMEFLWDFLNHQKGPRLRDHLSHGEISLREFPKEAANQLLAFSTVLVLRFTEDLLPDFKEKPAVKLLLSLAEGYSSRCHPIPQLKKQVLSCEESLRGWPLLPLPEEPPRDVARWSQVLRELCGTRVPTLFCPRAVLEVLVVLRSISSQCQRVSGQVVAASELRRRQWAERSLRSRQRQTYLRMLGSLRLLWPMLRLLLLLVTLELTSIHAVCGKDAHARQQYLRRVPWVTPRRAPGLGARKALPGPTCCSGAAVQQPLQPLGRQQLSLEASPVASTCEFQVTGSVGTAVLGSLERRGVQRCAAPTDCGPGCHLGPAQPYGDTAAFTRAVCGLSTPHTSRTPGRSTCHTADISCGMLSP